MFKVYSHTFVHALASSSPGKKQIIAHCAKAFKLADVVSTIYLLFRERLTYATTEGLPEQISKRDKEFVSNIVTYDRWKYHERIQNMKLRQLVLHPSASRFALFTSFDYTKVPVSITVGPPEAFRPEDEINGAEFDATVKQTEEGKGRFTLMHARIAQGPTSIALWSAGPEESMIANPQSSASPDVATLREKLGLSDDEFARVQPRMLEYLDSLQEGRDVERLTKT